MHDDACGKNVVRIKLAITCIYACNFVYQNRFNYTRLSKLRRYSMRLRFVSLLSSLILIFLLLGTNVWTYGVFLNA